MHTAPFITLGEDDGSQRVLRVPPGHAGFVRHEAGRLQLLPGVHRLECGHVDTIFLVRIDGSHVLDLRSLGGAMLRAANGRWSPIRVLGRLVYGVARPEPLVDFLEREQILEPLQLERELTRLAVDLLSNVFDGEALTPDTMMDNLDVVSGELLRRLTVLVLPLGLSLHGLDLVPAPAENAVA